MMTNVNSMPTLVVSDEPRTMVAHTRKHKSTQAHTLTDNEKELQTSTYDCTNDHTTKTYGAPATFCPSSIHQPRTAHTHSETRTKSPQTHTRARAHTQIHRHTHLNSMSLLYQYTNHIEQTSTLMRATHICFYRHAHTHACTHAHISKVPNNFASLPSFIFAPGNPHTHSDTHEDTYTYTYTNTTHTHRHRAHGSNQHHRHKHHHRCHHNRRQRPWQHPIHRHCYPFGPW